METSALSSIDIESTLDAMAAALSNQLAAAGITRPLVVGIHSGGVWIAEALFKRLRLTEPMGTLDISFYRDDFTRIGMHPEVKPSDLPLSVEERHIILVDDVLHTGRTIRAALNEIFDFGRPASVRLVTLVERGGRELPIEPNVVGIRLMLSADQHIKLTGPSPLKLSMTAAPHNAEEPDSGV